jgi:cytochrome c biogenesis protein CcmG/thiol:disulfide interchange protein DsbE
VSQIEQLAPGPVGDTPRGRRVWLLIPLAIFLALVGLFYFRLGAGDPSRGPSALLNKPVPDFALPGLAGGGAGLADEDLSTGIHVINVWASWCGPCRLEHPLLMQLSADKRFQLVGINYKDIPENAERFIGALGNPFAKVGADRDGKTGIDWGVYGVPETFVVKNGVIVHKFIGPIFYDVLA